MTNLSELREVREALLVGRKHTQQLQYTLCKEGTFYSKHIKTDLKSIDKAVSLIDRIILAKENIVAPVPELREVANALETLLAGVEGGLSAANLETLKMLCRLSITKLDRVIEGMGWQPIEAIKKTEKEPLLLWDGNNIEIGMWAYKEEYTLGDYDRVKGWGWYDESWYRLEPTHGMPLPPQPESEA